MGHWHQQWWWRLDVLAPQLVREVLAPVVVMEVSPAKLQQLWKLVECRWQWPQEPKNIFKMKQSTWGQQQWQQSAGRNLAKPEKLAATKTAAATVKSGNKATTSSAPLPHSSVEGITIGGGNGGIDIGQWWGDTGTGGGDNGIVANNGRGTGKDGLAMKKIA